MFPQNYESRVDELLEKLFHSKLSSSDTINLLDLLSCATGVHYGSRRIPIVTLTVFEKHLLKGALPHCLQSSKVQPTITVPQDTDTEPAHHSTLPRITEAVVHDGESAPITFPTSTHFHPRRLPTCLTSVSVEPSHFQVKASAVLKNVGKDSDIRNFPSLFVTRNELRRVLMTLPRWAFWNQWTDDQRREIRKITQQVDATKSTAARRHAACKYPGKRTDVGPDDSASVVDPECTFAPKLRPYPPRYLLSRPGRARNDPLAVLRAYCKHFHAGDWIRDYETLVDDLRECTFHPNIHKYLKRSQVDLKPSSDPFSGGDPFSALKEHFEEDWEIEKKKLEESEVQDDSSPNIQKPRAPWTFDDEQDAPKYSGLLHTYHRHCVRNGSSRKAASNVKSVCSCDGLCEMAEKSQARQRQIRPKRWEHTLREGFSSSSFSTNPRSPTRKRAIDAKKEKRYYNYDWGKYIRLNKRHLIPVCVPDMARFEAILRDAEPPWSAECPPETLVEWSGGGDPRGAVFAAKTPVEDYKVNRARNWYSVVQHGVTTGELLPPLRVLGIRRDAVTDLEKRLAAAKPTGSLSCIWPVEQQ